MMSDAISHPVEGLHSARAQRALLALHGTMDFAELWGALQKLFETVVPHDTLVMSVNYLDWRKEATTRRLTSARSRVIDDEASAKIIVEEGRNFFQPFLEKNPGIPAYHHTQVRANPAEIPETRYYQRYMIPLGWRYSAHLLFWRGKNVETSFALRRRPEQGDFSPEEMELLRAVHPHIAVAFERARTFEGERRRRRLLENFYRAKPEAVLFLDWDLNVLYASQEALGLCAAWNLGADRARQFTPQSVFAMPAEITAVCETLRPQWPLARGAQPAPAPLPLTTEVVAARPGYAAAVTLRSESGAGMMKPIFIVRLRGPDALAGGAGDEQAQARLLASLTPAERELSQLVCAGLSNKEIAAQLKRSEGSVKVQLSGIFSKLGVRSRTQLIVALR